MASKTYYAWSPIIATVKSDDEKKPDKVVKVARGEKVDAKTLGISEEEFRAYVLSGAIRDKKYPAPEDYEGSAIDWLRDQLAEAQGSVEEAETQSEISELEASK